MQNKWNQLYKQGDNPIKINQIQNFTIISKSEVTKVCVYFQNYAKVLEILDGF